MHMPGLLCIRGLRLRLMLSRHGTGRLDTAEGEMYEGAWKTGHRHGTGTA